MLENKTALILRGVTSQEEFVKEGTSGQSVSADMKVVKKLGREG